MTGPQQNTLGIYVSIPFCRSKCTYCNFASGVYPASEHVRYVDRLIADLVSARTVAEELGATLPNRVDTVYLGGGTPSLLAPELLVKLFDAIRCNFDVDPDAEITMECAPGQLSDATLEAMAACGVNRVSLGVQSFVDAEARASGRLHNRATVERDIARLRAAGLANINIDLIAGLAGQTLASWEESLTALINLGAPHASVYMLEVDEDSRLGRELLAGGAKYGASLVPEDEIVAQMYGRACERLAAAGIAQYEISNFARAGAESRHNLRYWRREPYLGVGLDASSMLRVGRDTLRWAATSDLQEYLNGVGEQEAQLLNLDRQHEEAWFLGLRLNEGVEIAALEQEFGAARVNRVMEPARRLAEEGLVVIDNGRARLTAEGRLFSNDVFAEFLEDVSDGIEVLDADTAE